MRTSDDSKLKTLGSMRKKSTGFFGWYSQEEYKSELWENWIDDGVLRESLQTATRERCVWVEATNRGIPDRSPLISILDNLQQIVEEHKGYFCRAAAFRFQESIEKLVSDIMALPDFMEVSKFNLILVEHCFSLRRSCQKLQEEKGGGSDHYFDVIKLFRIVTGCNAINMGTDIKDIKILLYRAAEKLSPDELMKYLTSSIETDVQSRMQGSAADVRAEINSIISEYSLYPVSSSDTSPRHIYSEFTKLSAAVIRLERDIRAHFLEIVTDKNTELESEVMQEISDITGNKAFWSRRYRWKGYMAQLPVSLTAFFSPPPKGIQSIRHVLEAGYDTRIAIVRTSQQASQALLRRYARDRRMSDTEAIYQILAGRGDPFSIQQDPYRWHRWLRQTLNDITDWRRQSDMPVRLPHAQ